ncbi:MAG: family 16 glycoside hydrolase [Bacteroidota bacterium]
MRFLLLITAAVLSFLGSVHGQVWDTLSLNDLTAFVAPSQNWSIVGSVSGSIDSKDLKTERGTGMLYSQARARENLDILTKAEHRDIDLELEFMLPEGGESGVFLQGRYEIQLKDSWEKERPTFLDCGAVYPRSMPNGGGFFEGKPPRVNAAKAPGLWQHLSISFRAARFDQYGEKTENAKLRFVKLNGVLIHQNVTLTGPTDRTQSGEVARGPLRLQGNSGQVAFRNIRFQTYDRPPLKWKKLKYESGEMPDRAAYNLPNKVEESGEAASIDPRLVARDEKLVLRFTGDIDLPVSGLYKFDVEVWWNAKLTVDGKPTNTTPSSSNGSTEIELEAGIHEIVLEYYKWDAWYEKKLALYLTGPGIARQPLHEEASLPVSSLPTPYYVDFDREPQILRGFTNYPTDPDQKTKLTHTIHVGLPEGVAFTYDPLRAIPIQIWRGLFLDATPMWAGRGDGSVAARGPNTWLDTLPVWIGNKVGHIRPLGYRLDEQGIPTFETQIGELTLSDQLHAVPGMPALNRRLSWSGEAESETKWRLASGKSITKIDKMNYLVDDTYFIKLDEKLGGKTEIVMADDKAHLLVEPNGEMVEYQIIW